MLKLQKICKNYVTSSETVQALKGVDLVFRDKEFVSILGPSGCGKTTLLNIIGGLDHYTSGDLVINGISTKSYKDRDWDVYRNHRIGFIFQSYNLIPHQTILGNVELALTISGVDKAERIARAKEALDRVGLAGQYYKKPNQLSGGQCQRVAIARALVNNPEILLADEPTGALDTVTSIQIMDLIREIANERLVIMVTHNPELAEQYSTRIIRLLDGKVLEDTAPVSDEEYESATVYTDTKSKRGVHIESVGEADKAGKAKDNLKKLKEEKKRAKRKKADKKEKAKMSVFTAFRLSSRNLISKKGRTTMVGIAGSIGIIGIAMVLAFSAGIKGYIKSMQDDMLSGNPIQITETTYDLEALTGMMTPEEKAEVIKSPGKVYVNSLVKYIAKMTDKINSFVIKNDLTEHYIQFVKEMPKDYYSAMLLDYGIDMSHNLYTDFRANGETKSISISALTNIYTSVLQSTEYKDYASYITQIVPSFKQAPDNKSYIESQYEIVGEIADEYDEVMLVLDENEQLSDLLLARLGYYTQEEFFNIIKDAAGESGKHSYPKYFTHEQLLGKTFTWYPNDSIYMKNPDPGSAAVQPFFYFHDASTMLSADEGVTLKVVGILHTNETTTYGCLSSGIYYTEDLTNYVLEQNMDSAIANYLRELDGNTISPLHSGSTIAYTYQFQTYEGETKTAVAYVGDSLELDDLTDMFGGSDSDSSNPEGGESGEGGAGSAGGSGGNILSMMGSIKKLTLRHVGGNDLANAVSIYPISFDSKNLVTDYLDKWNSNENITLYKGTANEITLTPDDRQDVKYTDALELIINLINGMIDVVSAALIAFTSISLVVSTVMIGIITYVSVVERIKEIGVIRSLGGRKKDVSRLFTAETAIIGFLSGLFGIGITYGISAIASAIILKLFGIPRIAALPVSNALILIALSMFLTLISGVLPAKSAAKKDPVVALRTE